MWFMSQLLIVTNHPYRNSTVEFGENMSSMARVDYSDKGWEGEKTNGVPSHPTIPGARPAFVAIDHSPYAYVTIAHRESVCITLCTIQPATPKSLFLYSCLCMCALFFHHPCSTCQASQTPRTQASPTSSNFKTKSPAQLTIAI